MSLASALRLLTRFRIPGKEIEQSGRTLFWFPIVGLFWLYLLPLP